MSQTWIKTGNNFNTYTKIIMCGYQNNYFGYQNGYFVHQNNAVSCFLRIKYCFEVFIYVIMFDFGSYNNKE